MAPVAATNDTVLNPELLKIASVAFDECLKAAAASQPGEEKARAAFRISVAQAIMRVVASGERDIEVLKAAGLKSVRQRSSKSDS